MNELEIRRLDRRLARLNMAMEIRMWRKWYLEHMDYIANEYERNVFMALPSIKFCIDDPNTVFNTQCKQMDDGGNE